MTARRTLGVYSTIFSVAPGVAFAQSADGGVAAGTIVCGVLALLLTAACGAAYWLWRLKEQARDEMRLLTDAFSSETAPVLVTRRDGAIVAANRAWRDTNGYDRVDPLHVVKRRLVESGDAERLAGAAKAGEAAEAALSNLVDAGAPQRLTTAPIAANASYVLWRIEETAPSAPAAASTAFDDEFDKLIARAGGPEVGAYVVDGDGSFLHANDSLASWLGAEDGGDLPRETKLHEVLRLPNGAPRQPYFPVPGDGDTVDGDATLICADGAERAVRVSSAIVAATNGAGVAARGVVVPVAAANDAPPPTDQSTGEVFERAPFGIAFVDLLGRIVDANAAFADRTEFEPDALIGKFLKDLIADDDREKLAEWHASVVRDAESSEPVRVRFRDRADETTVLNAVRSAGGDERPAGLIVFALDAGEQVEIDLQAVQTQKMELVGQLAGGVAHDFNNLLTAMIGFCDLLLLRHSPKDHSFADIMQIKQNANRAANLVRQLLAFSRQQTLQPKVLDLTNVLAELSHLLSRLIGATIELKMTHGRDLGLVKVDQGQFEQVVINLAVNARDAMADGGTLTIQTMNVEAGDPRIAEHEDLPEIDYVVIEVKDTGCGIPARLLDKIYEPFFTTKEVGSGTGLGLSTVYGIIKQTGGYIFVTSTEGVGTTFTIFLPGYRPEDAAADLRSDRPEDERRRDLTGAGTVLLVEDEDAVRLFGARALRNKGYDVIEASNGENAIEILESGEHELDLLITDVVMPGLDGPALIRRVRGTHPDLKVIFISGYTEDTFRKRLDDGAEVHFLPKPFSLQQLAGKVKEVMQEEEAR